MAPKTSQYWQLSFPLLIPIQSIPEKDFPASDWFTSPPAAPGIARSACDTDSDTGNATLAILHFFTAVTHLGPADLFFYRKP